MVTVGVDAGTRTMKVAILTDRGLLSSYIVPSGFGHRASSQDALQHALRKAQMQVNEVSCTFSTGIGREEIAFADRSVRDIIADAKAAVWLFPSVRTVVDVGAEESRVVKCDGSGRVLDFARNEKCAAGAGTFVETMARALDIRVEEMAALASSFTQDVPLSATCAVFAETEVVSLIHSRTTKANIARAIHNTVATKIASLVQRVGMAKDLIFIGGLANNRDVVKCLGNQLGVELLVPEEPQIVTALGAALLARDTDTGRS